jgi:lysozyme
MPETTNPSASPRPVPTRALELIQSFEGLHDGDKRTPLLLEPQADPIGIYTVGWGYALFDERGPVRDYETAMRIYNKRWPLGVTREIADELLAGVASDVGLRVLRLLPPGIALSGGEYGALVSLCYNIGVGEVGGRVDWADSTVRRKLIAGDRLGAADAFLMWNMAGGRVLSGLVRRRAAERAMFLAGGA